VPVAEQRDPVTALADFYGRTLPNLAAVLLDHRLDDRGNCVSCSSRRPHKWRDCVHAFAAQLAAQQLNASERSELATLLRASNHRLGETAVKEVIKSIGNGGAR
jgi:hypothetical protein